MASSEIDICSQALDLIGAPPISSFEDNRVAATCGRLYDTQMNDLLARYPWRFAQKHADLQRENSTPAGRYTYEFTMPSDAVQPNIFELYRSSAIGEPTLSDYTLGLNANGNQVILTDEPALFMVYGIRPPEAQWPPHFYKLAVLAMAAVLAKPITEDTDTANYWQEQAFGVPSDNGEGGFLGTAKRIDAQQAPLQQIQDFTLIAAHQGGWGT